MWVKGQSAVSDWEAEKIELPLIEMGKLREKFTPGVGESKQSDVFDFK